MLEATAAWELDAALEDPQRYVTRTSAIARIAAGQASVVVGARGAGKTAASRLLAAESSREAPSIRIGLKDAFLVALRPLAVPGQRERASAFARFVMLLAALEAMMAEQLLQGSQLRELARRFAVALEAPLAEALAVVFSNALLYEVFGAAAAPRRGDLVASIGRFEQAVADALADRRALVLLDEPADRTVVAGALDPLRVNALRVLLTGLADLRAGPACDRLAPVVFTRPGLYARLADYEREPWERRRLNLLWSARELREVMARRLARAADRHAATKASAPAMESFLRYSASSWDDLWARTRARPRDAVFFLRAVARNARHRNLDAVDPEARRQAEKVYAAHLLQDMADEIRDIAPDVEEVMMGIARHGKRRMSAPELVEVIERSLVEAGSPEAVAGARGAIERFFEASAIGNWVGQGRAAHALFAHDAADAALDYAAPVILHPGLASALEIDLEAAA